MTPAIRHDSPNPKLSENYRFVSTAKIVSQFEVAGWSPIAANQVNKKDPKENLYAKHLVRLQPNPFKLKIGVPEGTPEVLIQNSYDGTTALKIHLGFFRCACANGLVIGSSVLDIRQIHTAEFDITNLVDTVLEKIPPTLKKVTQFQSINLSNVQKMEFASKAYDLKWPRNPPKRVTPVNLLVHRRVEPNPHSLWTTFNIIQENIVHRKLRSLKRTTATTISLNEKLWNLAETYSN